MPPLRAAHPCAGVAAGAPLLLWIGNGLPCPFPHRHGKNAGSPCLRFAPHLLVQGSRRGRRSYSLWEARPRADLSWRGAAPTSPVGGPPSGRFVVAGRHCSHILVEGPYILYIKKPRPRPVWSGLSPGLVVSVLDSSLIVLPCTVSSLCFYAVATAKVSQSAYALSVGEYGKPV